MSAAQLVTVGSHGGVEFPLVIETNRLKTMGPCLMRVPEMHESEQVNLELLCLTLQEDGEAAYREFHRVVGIVFEAGRTGSAMPDVTGFSMIRSPIISAGLNRELEAFAHLVYELGTDVHRHPMKRAA